MAEHASVPVGRRGEDLAAEYLERKGYRVLVRNYRFQREEIDLVCFQPYERYTDGGELVVVEVKTRRGRAFGEPIDAVDEAKQRAIYRVTEAFLHEYRLQNSIVRFDVVSITFPDGKPHFDHVENAFGLFGFE